MLSPKTLFKSLNLVKSYDKTSLTVFVLSMAKIQVGLNFWPVYFGCFFVQRNRLTDYLLGLSGKYFLTFL